MNGVAVQPCAHDSVCCRTTIQPEQHTSHSSTAQQRAVQPRPGHTEPNQACGCIIKSEHCTASIVCARSCHVWADPFPNSAWHTLPILSSCGSRTACHVLCHYMTLLACTRHRCSVNNSSIRIGRQAVVEASDRLWAYVWYLWSHSSSCCACSSRASAAASRAFSIKAPVCVSFSGLF